MLSVTVFGQRSQFKATFIKAQQENKEVVVTISDGNTFSGFVESIGEESAGVKTKDGVFNFRYDRIVDVRIVNSEDESSRWNENPAKNKLFVFQTGKMLDAGSGYYQNTLIFFSNFVYGITENISVDAGFSIFPAIGIENQLYSIGAKIGTSIGETLFISGNIKRYRLFDGYEYINTAYGSVTFSKKRLDLTGSTGIGFAKSESTKPIFIVGAQYRVSEVFMLLSENLHLPSGNSSSETIYSFGGRLIIVKSAFDFGFATENGDDFFPIISYTLKF